MLLSPSLSPTQQSILPPAHTHSHTLSTTTTPPLLSLSLSSSSPQLILPHLSFLSLSSSHHPFSISLIFLFSFRSSCFLLFPVFSFLFLQKFFSSIFNRPLLPPPLCLSSPPLFATLSPCCDKSNAELKKKVQLVNRSFKKGRAMISLRVEQHSDFSRFRQYHCPSSRGNDDSTAFHGNADCQ